MRSLSSIFSFDTLQIRWGIPRGLLTAIVLLGILDFGLSRADWPYRQNPSSYVGTFLAQEEALRRDPVPPRIIILGNSRSKCGLVAQDMERQLGLPDGAVLNLSIESGDHYDNYIFQERNRQRMKSARLLIYGVDGYQWNASFPLSERFPHFAGLADRLDLEPSIPSLFGWLFRTEEKAALYHAIFRRIKARLTAIGHVTTNQGNVNDRAGSQSASPATLGPVEGRVAFWYKHFRLSPKRLALLQQVITTAREDGQRVVIVQLPFRDEYVHEVFRTHAADYDTYEQSVRGLDGVDVRLFETASDCGLKPSDFQDWDHLDPAGAEKFTRVWCDWFATHEKDTLIGLGASAKQESR